MNMKTLLKIIGCILIIVCSALFGGFILMKFYDWCLVPLLGIYFNYKLPAIAFGMFVMLDVGIAFVKYKPTKEEKERTAEESWGLVLTGFVNKAFYLLLCWITYSIVF